MRRVVLAVGIVLLLAVPERAGAQLFFSTTPASGLRIGPLMVRAKVTPELTSAQVNVLFSVMPPPGKAASSTGEDLYLLWPGEVRGDPRLGGRDQALARAVEEGGFDVVGEGRLALFAQRLFSSGGPAGVEAVAGGAAYVTFVQSGGALGLSSPAAWIRIPWTPKLTDPGWLMDLQIPSMSLVKPKPATWLENALLGRRYLFSMSFNEVRDRPLFPMYFAHRDRVVRLAEAPAELVVNFADSDRLKVDQVYPLNTIRRLSETLESTQVVSLFLDTSEGIAPQQLSVQFGYFSRVQSVAVVVFPLVFLGLGYAVGPLIGRMAALLAERMAGRIAFGSWNAGRERSSGVMLGREVLAKIVPGETTFDDVVRLCGPATEVIERFPAPGRRTVVYRGQRVHPSTRRRFGWLSTVQHLEVERQEVRIELEGEIVRDVQADLRRSRISAGERR
jgi:hypothetical protein